MSSGERLECKAKLSWMHKVRKELSVQDENRQPTEKGEEL